MAKGIKVIEKALNILELLASEESREFPLGEIADTLNMDHGTCSNIIKTLASRGYINQKGPRCGYKFGYMPLRPFWLLFKWQEWLLYQLRKLKYEDYGKKKC